MTKVYFEMQKTGVKQTAEMKIDKPKIEVLFTYPTTALHTELRCDLRGSLSKFFMNTIALIFIDSINEQLSLLVNS